MVAQRETAPESKGMSAESLRRRVKDSLRRQGFTFSRDGALLVDAQDKAAVRGLHREAVEATIERARDGLARHEDRLLQRFADGCDLEPTAIRPLLHEVIADSDEELLFRYAKLHWSIPVSAGYGRRLRFLILDESNGKLIGIFGLGDPVFALGARDQWIGWDRAARRERLRNVMDAFVVGAVPPYSQLLGGKLVALLMTSQEVLEAFSRKYGTGRTLITGRVGDPRLALLTTSSALGRSSMYNRLSVNGAKAFVSVGFTTGSGEFHLSNGVYKDLVAFAYSAGGPTTKDGRWGNGWRNRREVIHKVLPELGLSRELVYHGIHREVFVAPLAPNTCEFLRGEHDELQGSRPAADCLFEYFRTRWLLPRAGRDQTYSSWKAASLRLWPALEKRTTNRGKG